MNSTASAVGNIPTTMANLTTTTILPTTMNSTHVPLPRNLHVLIGVWLFTLVYIFVMAVATVIVNGLTFYAIYKDPLKCFRNPLAIFVAGVIGADFLTGLIGEPLIASGIAHLWQAEENLRVGFYIFLVGMVAASVTVTVSFMILLSLAISQLLAIGWPRRYERCVSVLKAKLGIFLICFFTLFVTIGCAVMNPFLAIVLLGFEVTFMTIALVILYLIAFCVFRSRISRQESEDNEVVNREFLKSTFFLVMVQLVTVWPYIACSFAIPRISTRDPEHRVNLEIVRSFTIILYLSKFLLDPLILVWRLPNYRKSMKIVYASCLARCGCAGGESATEARAVYAETRHEDFEDNSQEDNVNVEVI